MKDSLYQLLADPVRRFPFVLERTEIKDGEIISGILRAQDGTEYPIESGIPRLGVETGVDQLQTSDAFGFKWHKQDSYDSLGQRNMSIAWLTEKYGFGSLADWAAYYSSRRRILDVGCGSGFSSSLWLDTEYWSGEPMWVGVDISRAIEVAQARLGHLPNTHFVQADALHLPFPDACFDTIFSEGVLHHTPSTSQAIHAVARLLEPGGEFHFYVYRRKGPVREFTDDYIREKLAELTNEEAWEAMRSLTQLGQALAELATQVKLEEDVPLLGIKAGQYDVQRLIYWNFAKLYWNEALSFEENVHVNFDWYRPHYAFRQTAAEVQQWCQAAALSISWFHEQESGFTVRATKQ